MFNLRQRRSIVYFPTLQHRNENGKNLEAEIEDSVSVSLGRGGPVKVRGMKIMGCLLMLVCAAGCATMNGVVQAKAQGEGTSRVYGVNADRAWEIAKTVLRLAKAEAVEEHRSEGYMLARIGESLISSGIVMGVWIEPIDDDSTRVTVVIRRRNPVEFFVPLTETEFHDDFQSASPMNLKKPKIKP